MPPYERPKLGTKFIAKFIRIRKDLFVGRDINDNHKAIIGLDNLEKSVNKIKQEKPEDIDAGWVSITGNNRISIFENSISLNLPVLGYENKAREITKKTFAEQSPDYTVTLK